MVRLTGPLDVPLANVRNTRRVIEPALDQTGAQMTAVGSAVGEILGRARDQQIENQVAEAELLTRRQLDELRTQIENEPASEGEDYGNRWQERADKIVETNSERLTSPAHQRLWRQRTGEMLVRERAAVDQFAQTRMVQSARAGLLSTIGVAQTTLIDENATPQARAEAMTVIEMSVRRAVERRTLAADDGERMIQAARANQAEFEQNQGMNARAQVLEDQIYAASGGDAVVAREMMLEIDEPGLRDRVDDRITVRFDRENAAQRDALDAAMGRAYARIEQGGSLDGLAPGDRALIVDRGQMDTLRNYQRNRAGGGAGSEATTRFSEDRRNIFLALSNEDELAPVLADLDLYSPLGEQEAGALGLQPGQSVADQVRPGDLLQMRTRQRQMRGEIPLGDSATIANRAYTMLWANAAPQAQAQGVGLSGRQEDADNVRSLRGFLQREATAFVENERRLPNQREMQEITALALTQARVPRSGNLFDWDGRSRRVFESRPNADVRVRFSQIPQYQRERLARAYIQRNGSLPESEAAARDAIEQMYQLEVAGEE